MRRFTVVEWRRLRGLTAQETATKVGVSYATWVKWESEPGLIPIGKADLFCKLVEADPTEVIFLP